jgi:AAA ATPase-like protein
LRLKRFSVQNYRSIRSTPRIDIGQNLTIIGPNNEGKSNIVRALVTALKILEDHARRGDLLGGLLGGRLSQPTGRSLLGRPNHYDFSRDCHVEFQTKKDPLTHFYLEFELDDRDIDDFHEQIGSAINEFLPIEIIVGRDETPKFEVKKQGKAKKVFQKKSVPIAKFIGSRLSINHIPAIRTADEAVRAVSLLASTSIRRAENDPRYKEAISTIDEIQKPIYEALEDQLTSTLQRFLPNVKDVSLGISAASTARALRSVDIVIDDGQATDLKNKGDGVISLVGMALLARLRESSGASFNTVLVIEEPESHLHPRAIHSIRDVLDNIGYDYQVIVTTHSPVLADRLNIDANVIVESNKARIAKDVSEIREALGVKVSDSLSHARIVLICEGPDDQALLSKELGLRSETISVAIKSGDLSFYPLKGAGNVSYVVSMLQQAVAEPVCMLDDDASGHSAADRAIVDGLIPATDIVFTSLLGKKEAELEDLIDDQIVEAAIQKKFKVGIKNVPPALKKHKFSVRCEAAFKAAGALWNDTVKAALKAEVGAAAIAANGSAIKQGRTGPIERVIELLEEKVRGEPRSLLAE